MGPNPSSDKVQRFSLPSRARGGAKGDPAANRSILVIEDNRADALLVLYALEEHQVEGEVILLADGEVAQQYIGALETCPDLVILDLNLPKRTGREVLEYLRENSKCHDAPVVILSSSDAQEDRDRVAGLQVQGCIRKPSRLADFRALGGVFKSMLDR